MKKYWIETYGCQMNKAESESLELDLTERSWVCAREPGEADLVILNTCSVRKTAEDRIWGRLGGYKPKKQEKPFKLVLMGCMSERLKEEILNEAPHINILVGNFQKHRLLDFIEDSRAEIPSHGRKAQEAATRPGRSTPCVSLTAHGEYRFSDLHYNTGGPRAFVPIMHGCNNYCSYCIVPYVRGPEVSRNPKKIMAEISRLDKAYVREITLLGQNVNSYNYSCNGTEALTFPALLKLIVNNLKRIEWVRFITSHPKDFSEELIRVISEHKAICRHIHLPVQHGSDRILKLMRRGYTRGQYLNLIERIKNCIGGVSITTDILIGFPGENREDFRLTLKLMEEVGFDDAFTYRYNPRKGTRAYQLEDSVTDSEKRERLIRVIELQRRISKKKKMNKIGSRCRVLVEGFSKKSREEMLARTEYDEMVVFPGKKEKIGHYIRVELTSLKGNTFAGKEVK